MLPEIWGVLEISSSDLQQLVFVCNKVANELADDRKTESDIPTRKRRGGELKLREMQRVIFGFLLSYLQPFLWQLEESDPFYIIPLYDLTERFSVKDKENDYFCVLLAEVLKDLDDRVKKLSALATAQADSKKTKKGNLTDLLKIYKEFMTTCAIVFPKSRPETFPPLTMLRCLLQNVLDHINSASLETNEKSNDEISLIENLYNLDTCIVDARIPALAEDRKQVRQKRTAEVEKYVTNSIVLQFSKFIAMTDEIDKKLASKSSSVQIQTYVYTNRNEYKKLGKDFAFKIIKKSIEKVFKSVKKQCTDKVLFTSIWHLIAEQIIRQIEKIHEYLKTYFVRIPEVQVDFEIDDLKQFMSSLDMES
ncbi:Exocyst complex component 1 [Thelohanellus kitauei]|uniref:Exocyst complex component 1 n=1 Tax=Thelohanellus kitauei TaxID=669202 RepID=A0A0C2JAJ1_THEKT|nr:Exocyst complex component 1 [Thelohanellus kitauei]